MAGLGEEAAAGLRATLGECEPIARLLGQALGADAGSPDALPAQLRFVDPEAFRQLFGQAGLSDVAIEAVEAHLTAPSARWLADRIQFAPGMGAWISRLGKRREEVIEAFAARIEAAQGTGPVRLGGVASVGLARVAPVTKE